MKLVRTDITWQRCTGECKYRHHFATPVDVSGCPGITGFVGNRSLAAMSRNSHSSECHKHVAFSNGGPRAKESALTVVTHPQ